MANTTVPDEFLTWFMNSTIPEWNNETVAECYNITETDEFNLTYSELPNFYNTTSAPSPLQYPNWYAPSICAITPTGILFNLVFLFTVARVPSIRTTTTYYLVNLAMVDLTFLTFNLLNIFTSNIAGNIETVTINAYVKVIVDFIIYTLAFTSGLTDVALCVERFIAIYKPIKFRQIISKSSTIKAIAAIWFVSALLSAPIFPLELFATELQGYEKILWSNIIIFPVVMVLVVVVLYSIQIIMLYRHQKRAKYIKSTSQVNQIQVFTMLVINTMVYVACLTPLNIGLLIWLSGGTTSQNYRYISIVFLNINASVNMIIYNAVSTKYRRALVSAFTLSCTSKTEKPMTGSALKSRPIQLLSYNK